MKKHLYFIMLLWIIVFWGTKVYGQCSNCNSQFPPGTQSTTSTTFVTISTCMYGGEYAVCNVVAGQTYQWQTCGDTDFDTQITLWPGASCTGSALAYNDDFCGLQSQITWTATFTGTVRVLISRFNCTNQSTCMTLQWRCTTCSSGGPANDLVCNATAISCGQTLSGTTVGASNSGTGENTTCGVTQTQPGVWYTVTGNGQLMTASLCGTAWDSKISVFSGTSCSALTCIGGNDDNGPACSGTPASYSWNSISGTVYYILVHGFSSNSAFNITLTCASSGCPSGGYCMSNTPVTTCSGTYYDSGGNNNYSNNESFTQTFCPSTSGQCLRFNFTSFALESCCDQLQIYNGNSIASPLIGTYTSTSPGIVTASNPSGCLTFRFTSDGSVTFSGWQATISCVPCSTSGAPIQDCIGAMTICNDATVPGNASGEGIEEINASNNGCLSSFSGENQSSWYIFSPQTSGNISLSINVNTATDYDWAIWGPYPSGSTTSTICPPNQQPIRCSFASGGTTFSQTGSYNTGMGHPVHSTPQFAPPTPAIYDGTGNTLNGWTPGLQVTAGQVYVLLVDNWSANNNPFTLDFTLSGGATLGCTVLPIELLNFNIKNLGGENLLDWNTASEMNSDYFVIERAIDANNFYEIGRMKAMGNSHIQVGYAFIDKKPNYGYNYYRLKMVDFDGSYKYSEIKAVKNLFDSNFSIKSIYPNPSSNEFYIDLETNTNENLVITLTDVCGKKLNQFEYTLVSGNNTITINTDKFEKGLMFVNITSAQNSNINITQKIVKQ